MSPGLTVRRARRRAQILVLLLLALLLIPDPSSSPVRLSLVKVESAKAVDFGDGVVWVLALGSDARLGEALTEGRADAIQLIGLDFSTGSAIAIGILRDSWVNIPGHGSGRINSGLPLDGPVMMSRLVEDLVGIRPDYVVTTGFDGFRRLVDSIGGVVVRSGREFDDPRYHLSIEEGRNPMDGATAIGYARSRHAFPTQDFERSANQQELLRAMLARVRQKEDVQGFIERGALAAMAELKGLDTNLSASELYRFAQAVTQIELGRVTRCVVRGTPMQVGEAQVLEVNRAQAQRVGREARDDATLESGC